ncbi:hypothetical protein [Roseateles sp. LKC17W]|uniref:Uncharacterized protein n=1 Tax=Pelomonas margarita TaxID=3299031 RepID=A0ABW7FGN5_9BURK
MDTELLTNPGFWISIALVALAWGFGSMLKRAGGQRAARRAQGRR